MADKIILLMNKTDFKKTYFIIALILFLIIEFPNFSHSKEIIGKEQFLLDTKEINLTLKDTKDINTLKKLLKEQSPRTIYLEQWITMEKGNKNLLKKLHKITKKNDIKLFLFIGRDSWIGKRGVANALASFEQYGNYIDGLVLRTQPDKLNIWDKTDVNIQAQILNQMLDAYSAIYIELKKHNKIFIAEFPFWYSDFQGPLKSFSQNVCDYTDKIIFLIDDTDKLESLDIKWNKITCRYSIDLTKKALGPTIEDTHSIYKSIKSRLAFYQNFSGFIVDSDYKKLIPNSGITP